MFNRHLFPCCLIIVTVFRSSNAFFTLHPAISLTAMPYGIDSTASVICSSSKRSASPVTLSAIRSSTIPRKRFVTPTTASQQQYPQQRERSNLSLFSVLEDNNSGTAGSRKLQTPQQYFLSFVVGVAFLVGGVSAAYADGATKEFKLPPINLSDPNRCILKSSAMGQANAARDSLYDLRQCNLSGSNAVGFDLSGVIMGNTDLSKANLKEAYFSKGYLRNSKFDEADFTNAIVDRANFKGSSLRGTIFKNTVLTATSFEDADVENADFTDAYLGDFDIKNLCKNPTLKGENPITKADTRLSVGCAYR